MVHTSTKSDRRRGYVSVSSLSFQGAPVDPRDIQGRTPLFLAASAGGTDTVQLLMDRGADITLKDVELRSPLHAAIVDGDLSTMEALLKVIRLVIMQKMVTYTFNRLRLAQLGETRCDFRSSIRFRCSWHWAVTLSCWPYPRHPFLSVAK